MSDSILEGPAGHLTPKGKGFAQSHPLPPDVAASQQQQSSDQQLGKEAESKACWDDSHMAVPD